MSKIPYLFLTPVPQYFRDNGWFKNENTFKFVTWAFSKCQNITHIHVINGKEIILEPYEFIAGRLSSPKECFLTEEAFRHQLFTMQNAGFLKKTPNSTPNKFTCYIWVTERFLKDNPQLNPQLTPNKPPTDPHKEEYKKDISNDISNKVDATIDRAHPASPIRSKDLLSFDFEKWEFVGITEEDIANWKLIYPYVDLKTETLRAVDWLKSNPSKAKKTLWRKFLTNWFGRANDAIENKKAFRVASGSNNQDRRTKDVNGNPVESPHSGRF